MKPGKNDIRYKVRFEGAELAVLHKFTAQMCEAFGLDRKIEAYKGIRAITLYSWDLDCLEAVMHMTLRDPAGDGITGKRELDALRSLDSRIRELIASDKEPV